MDFFHYAGLHRQVGCTKPAPGTSMHLCVCVRVHSCVFVCVHAWCVRACANECVHACMDVCVQECVRKCVHACVHACMFAHLACVVHVGCPLLDRPPRNLAQVVLYTTPSVYLDDILVSCRLEGSTCASPA